MPRLRRKPDAQTFKPFGGGAPRMAIQLRSMFRTNVQVLSRVGKHVLTSFFTGNAQEFLSKQEIILTRRHADIHWGEMPRCFERDANSERCFGEAMHRSNSTTRCLGAYSIFDRCSGVYSIPEIPDAQVPTHVSTLPREMPGYWPWKFRLKIKTLDWCYAVAQRPNKD